MKKNTPLAVGGVALILLFCIARRDFWYPDEPDMAEITRNMLDSGDWLRLELYEKLFADYPPLFFWLTSAFGRLFGLSEMVLRLPTALSAVGLLALTGFWAERRLGERAALWSVIVLGTMSHFVWQAVNMHVDMPFAFFIGGSLVCYDFYRTASGGRRWALLAACSLLMGAASLTKGPAGIVLPMGIIGVVHLFHGERRTIAVAAAAGAGAVLVFSAWAVIYARGAGESNLVYFVFRQNVSRFLTGHSHLQPWYDYFVTIWTDLMPWSLFLPFAVAAAVGAARRASRPITFALAWMLVIFVFFTLSRSKRQVYLLPMYPAVAILIGSFIDSLLTSTAKAKWAWRIGLVPAGAGIAVSGIAIPLLLPRFGEMLPGSSGIAAPLLMLSAAGIAAGAGVLIWVWQRPSIALRCIAGYCMAAAIIGLGWLCPALDDPLSAKADAIWLDAHVEPGEAVGFFRPDGRMPKESSSLCFYGRRHMIVLSTAEHLASYRVQQPVSVLLVDDHNLPYLEQIVGGPVSVVRDMRIGSDSILAVTVSAPGKLASLPCH